MKTIKANRLLAKLATCFLALAMFLGLVATSNMFNVNAQSSTEVSSQDQLLTSNLLTDGGFENVTADDTGAWNVDTSSEAAGTKGTFEVSTDAYEGEKAVTLKGAGNDSGYPEISQPITVLPNTTYYVTMRAKNNNTSMSSANLFFGFASRERAGETVYAEQHRWSDNSVDKDKIYQEEGAWSAYNGFSLYTARLKTGNETEIRFYIRVQKMNVTIDDVTVTYSRDLISTGSENLLVNSGFESSNSGNPLQDWEIIGTPDEGFSAGIDDVRTSAAYTAGSNMQDKQIEGYNAMYIVAASGANGSMTIGQGVTVKENTYYGFYVNLSKWGEVKATAGVQSVEFGIYGADKETVLTKKTIDGADISMSRYMLSSVVASSGDNTTVYPYIKVSTIGFGAYGAGLYVDECSFFETKADLPEGKTNLLSNGNFVANSDGWYEVGGNSQLGWESGGKEGKSYEGDGNIWLSQWSPLDGIVQSVNLEADKLYKITVYARTYISGQASTVYDGLYSPVSIIVMSGDDETVSGKLFAQDSLENIDVIAKQNVRFQRDDAYVPVTLIFSVENAGTYSLFIGFEGGQNNNVWEGGMQLDAVSMYETSMDELSQKEDEDDYSSALINTSSNVTVSENSITLSKVMTVKEFKQVVYTASGYTMNITDASGKAVNDSDNMTTGFKVTVNKGEETVLSYTVTAPGGSGGNTSSGCSGSLSNMALTISACALMASAAVVLMTIKKKKNN